MEPVERASRNLLLQQECCPDRVSSQLRCVCPLAMKTGCPAAEASLETRRFSDLGADIDLGTLPEEENEDLNVELAKLEDEISTLRQVLIAKEKHLAEIKQKLGITPLNEIKNNLSKGWHDMQTSVIYKKTQETLNTTGQKASAALTNVSSTLNKKIGEMKNSPTFKSFEERVETTVSSLKCKVGVPTQKSGNFEDVLNSTANASVQESTSANHSTEGFGVC